jgi:hypothetical protein
MNFEKGLCDGVPQAELDDINAAGRGTELVEGVRLGRTRRRKNLGIGRFGLLVTPNGLVSESPLIVSGGSHWE